MTQETKIVIFACSTMTIVVLLLGAGIAIIQNGALMKMGIRQFMIMSLLTSTGVFAVFWIASLGYWIGSKFILLIP